MSRGAAAPRMLPVAAVLRPAFFAAAFFGDDVDYDALQDLVYDTLSSGERAGMDRLSRLELYFVSETRPGDMLTLHRAAAEEGETTVTVTLPEMTRPAFAARLRFEER